MKLRTLVIASTATFALVVPATQAAIKPVGLHAKTTRHVAVHDATKSKTAKVAAKVVRVTLPATLPQQDPNAVDCTYMFCSLVAGSDASASPVAAPAAAPIAQPSLSPLCEQDFCMC